MKAKRLNPDPDFQDNPSFENPAVESAAEAPVTIFEQAETGRSATFEESGSRAESPRSNDDEVDRMPFDNQ